jgi:hypothetical protein
MIELFILGKLSDIREDLRDSSSGEDNLYGGLKTVLICLQVVIWPVTLLLALRKIWEVPWLWSLAIVVNLSYFSWKLDWFIALGLFVFVPLAILLSMYLDND